jgi:Tol biopolymer transport system component
MRKAFVLLCLAALIAGCGEEKKQEGVEIFGGILIQLTDDGGSDPAWSPDGTEIAYVDNRNIWIMDVETKATQVVTSLSGNTFTPQWYPVAGKREIVFVNSADSEIHTIYKLDLNGGEPMELYSSSASLSYPSFTSDGSQVAFTTQKAGDGVMLVPADGGDVTEVPNFNGWNTTVCANASPTAQEICYVERIGADSNFWVIPVAGGDPVKWSNYQHTNETPNDVFYASFSRDGSKIVYLLNTWPYSVVRTILYTTGAGATPVRLTHEREDGNFTYPTWAPDGERLVCCRLGEIWILEIRQ